MNVGGDGNDGGGGGDVCEVAVPFFCDFLMGYCYCCCYSSLLPLLPCHLHLLLLLLLCYFHLLMLFLFFPCVSSLSVSCVHVIDFHLTVSVIVTHSPQKAQVEVLRLVLPHLPPLQ